MTIHDPGMSSEKEIMHFRIFQDTIARIQYFFSVI